MTIENSIEYLTVIKKSYLGDLSENLSIAISTMRKYQKIVQIMERTVDDGTSMYDTLQEIEEVIEDGND